MPRDTALSKFLNDAVLDAEDLYRSHGWSWTRLRREAGHLIDEGQQIADRDVSDRSDESGLLNAMPRLLHLDDEGRIDLLRKALRADSPPDAFSLSPAE